MAAPQIHSTAVIEPGATLGADCKIGPYCYIGSEVHLEEGNELHSHVTLNGVTTIGRGNEFFPFACIGGRTEDLKFQPNSTTRLTIGHCNVFREHTTVNTATEDGNSTIIGDKNSFLSHSHVGHDCYIGSNIVLGCGSKLAGHVQVHDNAVINGMTGVIQFVRLGKFSFVGAVNKVTKDVLPFMIAEGNPSRMRIVNSIGLERNGFDSGRIFRIRDAIRRVINSGGSIKSVSQMILELDSNNVDYRDMVDFMENSKLGIARFGG